MSDNEFYSDDDDYFFFDDGAVDNVVGFPEPPCLLAQC